jgi:FixJ family two-component response regulator
VFVVDDDDDLRESLVLLIEALGFTARGFADGEEFRRCYDGATPGCLVLDVWLPKRSGVELYELLLHEGKRLPVIFMTAHADVSTAVAAMKTGAIEFLEKPFDRTMLLDRIRKAIALDGEWRQRETEFRALDEQIASLTSTDRETLALLTEGHSNKSIAATLMISERAVELRRARLMQRLGARSLAELLDLTITHRVLDEVRFLSGQRQVPKK